MKLQVIAVKDLASGAFMSPSFVHSTGAALREFSDIVNKPGELIAKHPQDFEMFFLGEFDDNDGLFVVPASPQRLARGQDLVIKS